MRKIPLLPRGAIGAFFIALALAGACAPARAQFPGTSPQPVRLGATGRATLTANALLAGNGTNPVNLIVPGTSGTCLVSDGTLWAPGNCVGTGSVVGTAPITSSISAGVATIALNVGAGLTVTSSNLVLDVAHANTWSAAQTVNLNSAALPAALTGTVLNLGQADGTAGRIQITTFGAIAAFTGAVYGGTNASRTAVTSGTELASVNSYAYNGSALVGPISSFRSYAAENIASGHQGSKACIGTTAIAGTTLTDGLCQQNDGGVTIGSPTSSSLGAGTLNASQLYQNGVQVATLSGTEALTNKKVNGLTVTSSTGTLTIANAKTFTASNSLTLTGTDGTSFAFPATSDTVVTLGATQTLTSKALTAPSISGGTHTALTALGIRSTGSGAFDLTIANSENLTAGRTLTITLNDAARTVSLGGNLTLAAAFATSGANSLTLTTTGSTTVTLPLTGTLATLAGLEALSNKTVNGLTVTSSTGTLTIANAKTLTASNSLALAGTDGTTMTFPGTSDTVVTLTALQTLSGKTLSGATLSGTIAGTPSFSGANFIAFSNLPQLTGGLSVAGVAGNATGNMAAIAGTANQVLRVNGAGTVLGFGSIDLSQSATVGTSQLALANLASVSADNVIGNFSGSLAAPGSTAINNCANALTYSTTTHAFGCNNGLGTGSVTNVATATGLSGGPITSTGTIASTNIYGGGIQINGSMEVSQQFGTASQTLTATGSLVSTYIIDQWQTWVRGSFVAAAVQSTDAPAGYANSLAITVPTAEASLGANDELTVCQPVEASRVTRLAMGNANAQSLSVGWWTKTHQTGTFTGVLKNLTPGTSTNARSYPFTYSQAVADTWQYNAVTINGDTAGTWIGAGTGLGLEICFNVAGGSSRIGTAGSWAAADYSGATGQTNGVSATSGVFKITGVIAMPGAYVAAAADAPYVMRPFDEELRLSKRFWQKSYEYGTALATATITGSLHSRVQTSSDNFSYGGYTQFAVEMRAAPTVVLYSPNSGATGKIYNNAAGDITASAATASAKDILAQVNNQATTVGTDNTVHYSASARF